MSVSCLGNSMGIRSLLRIRESRVGPHRNVVIARAEVLQLWPERAKEPVTETQPPKRRRAPSLRTWPSLAPTRYNAGPVHSLRFRTNRSVRKPAIARD